MKMTPHQNYQLEIVSHTLIFQGPIKGLIRMAMKNTFSKIVH
ncbi:hypothetical protein GCM10010095_85240 [Streptomyces anthocyanicus]|nr:hypothetical protein GCM10010095_85240 [Streptomyces anthocyanicus]